MTLPGTTLRHGDVPDFNLVRALVVLDDRFHLRTIASASTRLFSISETISSMSLFSAISAGATANQSGLMRRIRPFLSAVFLSASPSLRPVRERLQRRGVLDQLDAAQDALSAHFADDAELLQRLELAGQVIPEHARFGVEFLLDDLVQNRDARGAGQRIPGERVAVRELDPFFGVAVKCLGHVLPGDHRAERDRAAGESLARRRGCPA